MTAYLYMVIYMVDNEILLVVIGIILGSIVSFISYQYKSRQEFKKKINEALFCLLEVWGTIGLVKFLQSEIYARKLIERIRYRFPHENISKNDEKSIIEEMIRSIPLIMNIHGNESVLDKYNIAIRNLSSILPVVAYELTMNQFLIKYLDGLDVLIKSDENIDGYEMFINQFEKFVYSESYVELEKDLKKLAFKSSLLNSFVVRKRISRINKRMNNILPEALDEYIDMVVKPLIQKHYDDLGVENPNNK